MLRPRAAIPQPSRRGERGELLFENRTQLSRSAGSKRDKPPQGRGWREKLLGAKRTHLPEWQSRRELSRYARLTERRAASRGERRAEREANKPSRQDLQLARADLRAGVAATTSGPAA